MGWVLGVVIIGGLVLVWSLLVITARADRWSEDIRTELEDFASWERDQDI